MRFDDPLFLLLLTIPIAYALRAWLHRRRVPGQYVGFPALFLLPDQAGTQRAQWLPLLNVFRLSGLVLLIVALARPHRPHDVQETRLRSRNLMVALDISSSMKAGDFQPGNRLEVARRVLMPYSWPASTMASRTSLPCSHGPKSSQPGCPTIPWRSARTSLPAMLNISI
jgi:Ca-activated chloride channel family protein